MTRTLLGLVALSVLGGSVWAQNPIVRRGPEKESDPAKQTQWSRVVPTESMWLYEQQKRDSLDPVLSMRERAEFTAWQRRNRLAATQWYGYSNSRPSWSPTPFMSGMFSPSWSGNDFRDPYRWSTSSPPVVRPTTDTLLK